jgi:hypothetical protein
MATLVEFGNDLPVLNKNDANRKSLAAMDEVYDDKDELPLGEGDLIPF